MWGWLAKAQVAEPTFEIRTLDFTAILKFDPRTNEVKSNLEPPQMLVKLGVVDLSVRQLCAFLANPFPLVFRRFLHLSINLSTLSFTCSSKLIAAPKVQLALLVLLCVLRFSRISS